MEAVDRVVGTGVRGVSLIVVLTVIGVLRIITFIMVIVWLIVWWLPVIAIRFGVVAIVVVKPIILLGSFNVFVPWWGSILQLQTIVAQLDFLYLDQVCTIEHVILTLLNHMCSRMADGAVWS